MANQNRKLSPPPIQIVIVDKDGRPTKEMGEFMARLFSKIQELEQRVQVLENTLTP